MASTRVTVRQARAWKADTHATAGGWPRSAAWRSAAAIAASGGRWSVCTTGVFSPVARAIAGASKA